jgi:hypothetical protein
LLEAKDKTINPDLNGGTPSELKWSQSQAQPLSVGVAPKEVAEVIESAARAVSK